MIEKLLDELRNVKRGEVPKKQTLLKVYNEIPISCLAEKINSSKSRVVNWFKKLQIQPGICGSVHHKKGNNKKFFFSDEEFARVYQNNSLKNVSEHFGMSYSSVRKHSKRLNCSKLRNQEFEVYKSKVYALTNKVFQENEKFLNPENKKRGLCGEKDAFQIDHIVSITECFERKWSVEEASSVSNLQFISWEENLKRRIFK